MRSWPPTRWLVSHRQHRKVTREERFFLVRQLHVLVKAGVPLLAGLDALGSQMPPSPLKEILDNLREELLDGRMLSEALSSHPDVFSPLFISMIRVGESGGLLDEMLLELSHLLEWELELRNQLKNAFTYPMIVLGTLGVAMTTTAVFVLPQFAALFKSFRTTLPLQTRLLIGVSDVLSKYGLLIMLLAIGAGIGFWMWIRTDDGRRRWHTFLLRLPILGSVFQQIDMSRFARVTAILTNCGIPILETLIHARDNVTNTRIKAVLDRVRDRVQAGTSLSRALKAEPAMSAIIVQMVTTGEETGHVSELLHSVSEYYDQQVSFAVKRMIAAIEPALIIMVSLAVLLLASSVFVPMWDLVRVFKQTGV